MLELGVEAPQCDQTRLPGFLAAFVGLEPDALRNELALPGYIKGVVTAWFVFSREMLPFYGPPCWQTLQRACLRAGHFRQTDR